MPITLVQYKMPPILAKPLQAIWPTGLAAQYIVLSSFRNMLDCRQAVLDNQDTEGVHKIRVAARRTRTAMQTFAGLLPGKMVKRHRSRLAKFTRAFGTARDLDVLLEYLADRDESATGDKKTRALAAIAYILQLRQLEQPKLETAIAELDEGGFAKAFISKVSHSPYNLWELGDLDG